MLTPAFLTTTTAGSASVAMMLAIDAAEDHAKALYALAGALGTIAVFALKALIAERKTRDCESKEREKDTVKRLRQIEDERLAMVQTFTDAVAKNTAAVEKLTNELRHRACPYIANSSKHEA